MDTASHLLIGLGLGAMAHLSPDVAANPSFGLAIMIGTVLASQAPDIDFIYKMKGTANYLKKHRGWTHSIPAWFIWPSLITLGLTLIFDDLPWELLWLWCFGAVLIHVATDILNTFGAEFFGIMLWWTGLAEPGPLFAVINTLVIIYIAVRLIFRQQAVRAAATIIRNQADVKINIMPTFHIGRWMAVIDTPAGFRLGCFRFGRFEEQMTLPVTESVDVDIEHLKQQSQVIRTFYSIANCIHSKSHNGGIQLTLTDLRFRYQLLSIPCGARAGRE